MLAYQVLVIPRPATLPPTPTSRPCRAPSSMLPANYDKLITSPIKVLQKQFDFSDTNDVALTKIATKNQKQRHSRASRNTSNANMEHQKHHGQQFRFPPLSRVRPSLLPEKIKGLGSAGSYRKTAAGNWATSVIALCNHSRQKSSAALFSSNT